MADRHAMARRKAQPKPKPKTKPEPKPASASSRLLPPGFLAWVAARLLAMLVVVGGGWLVYTASTSSSFQIKKVHVQGAALLSQADVEQAAMVIGSNVFWVDHGCVACRWCCAPK
jgi:cell division septal protein FtsQ